MILLLHFALAGDWQCPRVTTLYQAIKCPEGHYKVPESLFDQQCENMGLPCPADKGYSCYCKPCIQAFEVDVFQFDSSIVTEEQVDHQKIKGCSKVSTALLDSSFRFGTLHGDLIHIVICR